MRDSERVRIETSDAPPAAWDDYVSGHPSATAYHRGAVAAIGARAFGLRTTYMAAYRAEGGISGILPLVEQSSVLFGRFLVSLPFVTYGGVLADDTTVELALAQRAAALSDERRAQHLELRHTTPVAGAELVERLDKVSMVLPLPDSEQALARQLGSKLRSQIRRSEREQLELVWGGGELLDDFYRVFAPAMHSLGTPVYPRRFFEIALAAFGSLATVLVVRMRGCTHAAAITVRHGAMLEVPWAVASPEAKSHSVNMRMYWELLCRALGSGAGAFDFGRSTVDSGTYRFKAQWGAQPKQLHWQYWLPPGAAVPVLNQSNPKYAKAAALWRRMPLWCANLLGPRIVRNLP